MTKKKSTSSKKKDAKSADDIEKLEKAREMNRSLQEKINTRLTELRDRYAQHKQLAFDTRVALHMQMENQQQHSRGKQQQQQLEQNPEYSLLPTTGEEDNLVYARSEGPLDSWKCSVISLMPFHQESDFRNFKNTHGRIAEPDPFTVIVDPQRRSVPLEKRRAARLRKLTSRNSTSNKKVAGSSRQDDRDDEDEEVSEDVITNASIASDFFRHIGGGGESIELVGGGEEGSAGSSKKYAPTPGAATREKDRINNINEEIITDEAASPNSLLSMSLRDNQRGTSVELAAATTQQQQGPSSSLPPFRDITEFELTRKLCRQSYFAPPLDDDSDGLASIMLKFPPPGYTPPWTKEAVEYLETLVATRLKNLISVEEICDDEAEDDGGKKNNQQHQKHNNKKKEGNEGDDGEVPPPAEDIAAWTEIARLMNKQFRLYGNMPCGVPTTMMNDGEEGEDSDDHPASNPAPTPSSSHRTLFWGEVEFATNEERIHTQELFRQFDSMSSTGAQFSPITCAQQWHNVIRPVRDGRSATTASTTTSTTSGAKGGSGSSLDSKHGILVKAEQKNVNLGKLVTPGRKAGDVSPEFDAWLMNEVRTELLKRLDQDPESETIPNLDLSFWRQLASRAPTETPLSLCGRYMRSNLVHLCKQHIRGTSKKSLRRHAAAEEGGGLAAGEILEPSQPRPASLSMRAVSCHQSGGGVTDTNQNISRSRNRSRSEDEEEDQPLPGAIQQPTKSLVQKKKSSSAKKSQRGKRKRKVDSSDDETSSSLSSDSDSSDESEVSASSSAAQKKKNIPTPSLEPQRAASVTSSETSSSSLSQMQQQGKSSSSSKSLPPIIWLDPEKNFLLESIWEIYGDEATTGLVFSLLCSEVAIANNAIPTWYPLEVVQRRLQKLKTDSNRRSLEEDFPLLPPPPPAPASSNFGENEGDGVPPSAAAAAAPTSSPSSPLGSERALLVGQIIILKHLLGPSWRSIANVLSGGECLVELETYFSESFHHNSLFNDFLLKNVPAEVLECFVPRSSLTASKSAKKKKNAQDTVAPKASEPTTAGQHQTANDGVNQHNRKKKKSVVLQVSQSVEDGGDEGEDNIGTATSTVNDDDKNDDSSVWTLDDLATLANLLDKHVAWAAIPAQIAGGRYSLAECKLRWAQLSFKTRQEVIQRAHVLFDSGAGAADGGGNVVGGGILMRNQGAAAGAGGMGGAGRRFPQGAITVTSGLGVSTVVDGEGSTTGAGGGAFEEGDDAFEGTQSLISTAASSAAAAFGGSGRTRGGASSIRAGGGSTATGTTDSKGSGSSSSANLGGGGGGLASSSSVGGDSLFDAFEEDDVLV